MAGKAKDEPQGQVMALPLTVEERKARVERVRGLDARLKLLEDQLAHAAAMLPAMRAAVAEVRATIEENTRPPAPAEGNGD